MISSSTSQSAALSRAALEKSTTSLTSEKGETSKKNIGPKTSVVSKNANPLNEASPKLGQTSNKNTLEVDSYMQMISKFEQLIGKGEIGDTELENMFSTMEEKIHEMSSRSKKKLLNLPFFKKEGITNISELKRSLIEMFKNEQHKEQGLNFLKSDDFISLLLKKDQPSSTYSNSGQAAPTKQKNQPDFALPPLKAAPGKYSPQTVQTATATSIKA